MKARFHIVLVLCLVFVSTQALVVYTNETGDVARAVGKILNCTVFVKIGLSYMDYRKHGQFEITAPAILFACLVFTLTAPLYVCDIIWM